MQFSQSCSSKLKQHLNASAVVASAVVASAVVASAVVASAAAGPQNTLTNKIVLLILKNNFVSFPFKGFSKRPTGQWLWCSW